MEKERYYTEKGKRRKWIVVALLLLLIGTLGAWSIWYFTGGPGRSKTAGSTASEDFPGLVVEDAREWDGILPTVGEVSQAVEEFTEIPGYARIVLTKEDPTVGLINPSGNTVYFVYTLKNQGEIIHQTNAIEPDRYVDVDLYELLGEGRHTLEMIIECYDLTTQASCNGAVQEVEVTIR